MMQIRKVLLRGKGLADAEVAFDKRANILAGESDTGKSFIVHCLDYISGADALRKRIPAAEPYSQLFVQFSNDSGEDLTLERSLSGGNLKAYRTTIDQIDDKTPSETIVPKRKGKSVAADVTSILFPFSGVDEAKLRKNDRGETVRLTVRTMLPLFLVDEISVISDWSPVLGKPGFDDTSRKRMLVYLLSGKDDAGIVAAEKRDIVKARLAAQLSVISDLLEPLEKRLQGSGVESSDDGIDKVESAISSLSDLLTERTEQRTAFYQERRSAQQVQQKAESQILGIQELLRQYRLLDERYETDLKRLDFVAEGAHFFDGLQEVSCPLCDQVMSPDHIHKAAEEGASIYEAAKAEAAKILAHRSDLALAIESLEVRLSFREKELRDSIDTIKRVDKGLDEIVPAVENASQRLDRLVARRVDLEALRSDRDQAQNLRQMKEAIEQSSTSDGSSKEWEPLPTASLRKLCVEIEAVLKEWNWKGERRVEFDQREYDIIVDGQTRLSHGKGVRALLYSAFVIGLLRYCSNNNRPHLGTIVIDSPLTSYKKGRSSTSAQDGPVDQGVELAFWKSLSSIGLGTQIIVIENKEPPQEVARVVHYEWFAGENAQPGDRVGFIPVPSP